MWYDIAVVYCLNKIVGWITSPLGLMFLGIACGFAVMSVSCRLRRLGAWIVAVSVAMLWVMSCSVTVRIVGVPLERGFERDGKAHGSIEDVPAVDTILILGGGMGSHKKCQAPEMFASADRVWQGAKLYHAMKAMGAEPKVFCTGGGCEYATLPLLADLGVPRDAVSFSEDPRNTEEEAAHLKSVLVGDRPKVALVTSAWHMARAQLLFGRAGFDVVPVPADFEMSHTAEQPFGFNDFIPSAEMLLLNSCAVKEWVARIGYRFLR